MMTSWGKGTWALAVNRERILVSSVTGDEPDPDWRFTDSNGHPHRYAARGPSRRLVVPTVRWEVTDAYWCPDCSDEHEEGRYVCDECGEEVVPGTRFNHLPLYVDGPVDARITGLRSDGTQIEGVLSESEYEELRRHFGDEGALNAAARALLDSLPQERIHSVTIAPR